MAEKVDKQSLNPLEQQIYTRWVTVKSAGCTKEFANFNYFRQWAIMTGFTGEERLVREATNLPHSPRNSRWVEVAPKKITAIDISACKRWNKVVNKIREIYGMETLEDMKRRNEAEDKEMCRKWDEFINKVRKAHGMEPLEQMGKENEDAEKECVPREAEGGQEAVS